jgi:branched-subunit amino acid aminotransferase/4-amino-4-deoxychorismate lyase
MEEAGTMNVFFRINDTLFTAPVVKESLMVLPERVLLT